MINVGREAMLAVGCIQAQKCHTNRCPTGVATQRRWLMRGLDPSDKAARLANYVVTLRKELLALSRACGLEHPGLITADRLEILDDQYGSKTVADAFGWLGEKRGNPTAEQQAAIRDMMSALNPRSI